MFEFGKKKFYVTPSGQYYKVYADMLKQPHLLIAGATGSGKSVIVNELIRICLLGSPSDVRLILIDPKRVELVDYKKLPHTIRYASEPDDIVDTLKGALNLIEARYKDMQKRSLKTYEGADVYLVIDELADLMTTNKKVIQPCLQRICQIGRAAKVHVIACTQSPIARVLPTEIKVNFDARVGLRTSCAQDSRNILGITGCEKLPAHGQGFYKTPAGIVKYNFRMMPPEEHQRIIHHWSDKKLYITSQPTRAHDKGIIGQE